MKTKIKVNSLTKLTEGQVHEICKKLENGLGATEIAQKMGDLSLKLIIQQIKCRNIRKRISKDYDFSVKKIRERLNVQQVHEICKMLENGFSPTETAKNMGDLSLVSIIKNIKCRNIWKRISENYNFSVKKNKKLSEKKVKKICELLEQGLGSTEIAKRFGEIKLINNIRQIKSRNSWVNISKNYKFSVKKIKKQKERLSEDRVKEICILLEQGFGQTGIARRFGDLTLVDVVRNIKRRQSWKHISKNYNF